ncbi:hypothetical protein [Roseicella frigidaeris]|uniref:Uncharacterized protein n=1 Tax=Roseicella frigidaeris TaxID=2230885 RepID=A0A327LYC6_9PROT|nr:hypothetical protein [Roseicella frigidaeris]RAI55911.1 hypothetical protein DOO78_23465 [Roseicella frigidaeris]
MAYKRTGKPAGRPKKADLPLVSIEINPDGPPRYSRNVPAWWIAMAHHEARMVVEGQFRHGALRELGRQFGAERGGGKSPAAITKVRADWRYAAERDRQIALLQKLAEQDAQDPNRDREARAALRRKLAAVYARLFEK